MNDYIFVTDQLTKHNEDVEKTFEMLLLLVILCITYVIIVSSCELRKIHATYERLNF
jgi:hypothetical protein